MMSPFLIGSSLYTLFTTVNLLSTPLPIDLVIIEYPNCLLSLRRTSSYTSETYNLRLFYYFDGLLDTKISQSVHPAGMVISPITLDDNFGIFEKDGETCLMLDMENIHDYTGLAKYDFLILKTVQVIRDTCRYLNRPYPKTHEIDWDDQDVWADMIKNPSGIFQFEGAFAFESLKKFTPKSIFDMSIVTACIRPSGASYRDALLARKPHSNPSEIIDELLKDNLGYLIYQEDTIKFLQQICGLSGSESDNIRRAIARKQKDRLDTAMPSILEGYCEKSPQPRETAETEAKEFLQIIEDSASYQFGYNHSIAYCLLGYLCAYYRYYHPLEFISDFWLQLLCQVYFYRMYVSETRLLASRPFFCPIHWLTMF